MKRFIRKVHISCTMDIDNVLKFSIIFLIGFLSANFINVFMTYGFERPFPAYLGFSSLNNEQTPQDYIKEEQIKIYDDKIVINVKGASISKYAPTGSMVPILNENSNGIRIVPESEDEIQVGDIITYEDGDMLIVHRVIEKGIDDEGTYFIPKGDNNSLDDGKVRFQDIKFVTIAIIY